MLKTETESSKSTTFEIRKEIAKLNESLNKKIVVLDDDPTGVQTIHDIYILTQWNKNYYASVPTSQLGFLHFNEYEKF
ncbi:MAG: hypothetical protein WD469_04795 [Paenibacillaceae bacterium]